MVIEKLMQKISYHETKKQLQLFTVSEEFNEGSFQNFMLNELFGGLVSFFGQRQ